MCEGTMVCTELNKRQVPQVTDGVVNKVTLEAEKVILKAVSLGSCVRARNGVSQSTIPSSSAALKSGAAQAAACRPESWFPSRCAPAAPRSRLPSAAPAQPPPPAAARPCLYLHGRTVHGALGCHSSERQVGHSIQTPRHALATAWGSAKRHFRGRTAQKHAP